MSRTHYINVVDSATVSDTAEVERIRAHVSLFENARAHCGDGRHAEAIIIAQTCCEMVVARAIGALREDPGHASADYASLVEAALPKNRDNNYSMRNPLAQGAWRALTGDVLASASFWPEYETQSTKRNKIAHRGEPASKEEAEASIKTADAFITHITAIATALLGDRW